MMCVHMQYVLLDTNNFPTCRCREIDVDVDVDINIDIDIERCINIDKGFVQTLQGGLKNGGGGVTYRAVCHMEQVHFCQIFPNFKTRHEARYVLIHNIYMYVNMSVYIYVYMCI